MVHHRTHFFSNQETHLQEKTLTFDLALGQGHAKRYLVPSALC